MININFETLLALCIINCFICFLIFMNILKNKKKLELKFFGLHLKKKFNEPKKSIKINIEKNYYLNINSVLPSEPGYYESLNIKVKTANMNEFILVYVSNTNKWNSSINLKFGEEDKYVIFEFNNNAYISGYYIPK